MAADASRQAPVAPVPATKAPRWKALRRRDEEGRAWGTEGWEEFGWDFLGNSREIYMGNYGKTTKFMGTYVRFLKGWGTKD